MNESATALAGPALARRHTTATRGREAAPATQDESRRAAPPRVSQDGPYLALRMTVGAIYFYFGFLKFFPDLSPAEMLAGQTLVRLSFGMLEARDALLLLAVFECAIGLALLFNLAMRATFVLFLAHMLGTFAPLVVFPELTFTFAPIAPTTEGQYILKNLVFVAVGWFVFYPALFPSANKGPHAEPSQ